MRANEHLTGSKREPWRTLAHSFLHPPLADKYGKVAERPKAPHC